MSVKNVNVNIIMICRPSKEKKKKYFIFIRAMCVGNEIKVMKLQVLLHVLNFLTLKHNNSKPCSISNAMMSGETFSFARKPSFACLSVAFLTHLGG